MNIKNLFARIGMCVLLSTPFLAKATIITIDNGGAGFSQSGFTDSTFKNTYYGSNYMFDRLNVAGDSATWDPTSSIDWVAGIWKVEMMWTSYNSRADKAYVSIDTGSTSSNLTVNQLVNDGIWNDLGTYNFSLDDASVSIDDRNSTAKQYIIADAVRFTFISAAPASAVPAPGTFIIFLLAAATLLRLRRK